MLYCPTYLKTVLKNQCRNACCHYDYDFIDESIKSYFFKTNAHVFYRIEFKPTGYIFGEDVIWSNYCYEFSIKLSANSPKTPLFDSFVAPTIAVIFIDFFRKKAIL